MGTNRSGTTAETVPTLSFAGFVGGVRTVVPLGITVGSLVVALFLEAVGLLVETTDHQ